MLYESAARAEEILTLDIEDLDTVNRRASVVRKGGARDVIYWQTGTARLLPRLTGGRKRGPVFLTDRKAKPSVALKDVDPTTQRARLSYRRAATLFEEHTTGMKRGPFTPMLMALSGHTSVRSLAKYTRVSAEALGRWQAETDPASRRRR
jgi:integrase/recombinase XerC/integrase/recombinase XerD